MTIDQKKEADLFIAALELPTLEERRAYVRGACEGDDGLYQRVLLLMESHDQSQGPLDNAPIATDGTRGFQQADEDVGQQIGPYKLREKIGEGGFGVVYVAEQKEPVSRKVALKVIKPGMDSKDIIARFEAERQALAMMDHPNVAKVLDAGATESGRPYFVMELVHGVAITDYCDSKKLTNRQRLQLFIDVCHAVQHAHQKGIIHRDIKPSNIMVTMANHGPVVKVIDFGVAKALHHDLTDKSIYTGYGQMVGTPMYMSPEQAQLSSLDVDTRSDIYSLGVLLYELLTGTTPFDKETFKKAGFDEVRRLIREIEPRRPSEQVSTLKAEQISTVSESRGIDQRSLYKTLRGDVDWIVMKALEKDRTRRYEAANVLADDLRRFLHDEPVEACPPSRLYRFRKFSRRNKSTLAFGVLVLAGLLSGIIGLAVSNQMIAKSEEDKRRALESAEENFTLARKMVDDFSTNISEDYLLNTPAMQPVRKDLLERALEYYETFVEQRSIDQSLQKEIALTHYRVAQINKELSQIDEAIESLTISEDIFRRLISADPADMSSQAHLSDVLFRRAELYPQDSSEAHKLWKQVFDLRKMLVEERPDDINLREGLVKAHVALGNSQLNRRRPVMAIEMFQKAIAMQQKLIDITSKDPGKIIVLANAMNSLAQAHSVIEELQAAAEISDQAISLLRQLVNQNPKELRFRRVFVVALNSSSDIHRKLDNFDQALARNAECVEITTEDAANNLDVYECLYLAATAFAFRARQLRDAGDLDAAHQTYEEYLNFFISLRAEIRPNARVPGSVSRLKNFARIFNDISGNFRDAGHVDLEKKAIAESMRASDELIDLFPEDVEFRLVHLDAFGTWIQFLERNGRLSDLEASFEELNDLCIRIANDKRIERHDRARIERRHAITQHQLAKCKATNAKFSEAEALLRSALEYWTTRHDADPSRTENFINLIGVDSMLCEVLIKLDRQVEVEERNLELRQLIRNAEESLGPWLVVGALVVNSRHLKERGCDALVLEMASRIERPGPGHFAHQWTRGAAHYRAEQFPKALEFLEKAVVLAQDQSATNRNAEMFLAMTHWRLGNHDEARKIYHVATKDYHKPGLIEEAKELLGINSQNSGEVDR